MLTQDLLLIKNKHDLLDQHILLLAFVFCLSIEYFLLEVEVVVAMGTHFFMDILGL